MSWIEYASGLVLIGIALAIMFAAGKVAARVAAVAAEESSYPPFAAQLVADELPAEWVPALTAAYAAPALAPELRPLPAMPAIYNGGWHQPGGEFDRRAAVEARERLAWTGDLTMTRLLFEADRFVAQLPAWGRRVLDDVRA